MDDNRVLVTFATATFGGQNMTREECFDGVNHFTCEAGVLMLHSYTHVIRAFSPESKWRDVRLVKIDGEGGVR